MTISSLGKNLNILIPCDYTFSHNWMSFFCWYSIYKNLPEASVVIACNRLAMKQTLFLWTKRCQVNCLIHKRTDIHGQIGLVASKGYNEPILVVDPASVCIRDFEETNINYKNLSNIIFSNDHSDILSNCKDSTISLFTSYQQGWGTFVPSNWIDKERCPLISNLDFASSEMTVNESRIRNLWKSAKFLFNNVSRG